MVIFEESTKINGDITMENYGKSQFLMGKLTISMAIFNSYEAMLVKLPGRVYLTLFPHCIRTTWLVL